jgi:3-methyladenine DNA glycosylase AlkD
MRPVDLFNDIRKYCQKHADPKVVKKYQRYFKDSYDAWGLTHELVVAKVKKVTSADGVNLNFVLETAPLLIRTGKYEETSIAILMVKAFHKEWSQATFHAVEKWFGIGINNWAHTDFICGEIISLFYQKEMIDYTTLEPWRKAHNKFQRRAVPVSMIKPLKTAECIDPLFDFIEPMMMDPDREVHQGLGWFLREAWKKQPIVTEDFLLKWKDTAPRLIFQYATEKMTPEHRLQFRKGKNGVKK